MLEEGKGRGYDHMSLRTWKEFSRKKENIVNMLFTKDKTEVNNEEV